MMMDRFCSQSNRNCKGKEKSMLGTIQSYNYEKLYGFILGDDSQEYFFANADFNNSPKKFKGKRVKFIPDYTVPEDQHPRATNISTLGRDTITLVAVLDIESSEPYPQDIGKTLKVTVEREIEKLKSIEGTTITGTVSVGRQL